MSRKSKSTKTMGEARPALVPKLRFPEFRGAEGWSDEVLEDLLAMPATYGIVTAGEFQQEGVPMLRGGDIKAGRVGDGLPFVTAEIHFQYRRTILQEDDVVIALVGYPGEAAVVPQRYVGANISRAVGLLRLKDIMDSRFLACYLNSPIGRQTVLKPSAGSAQVVVNLKHLNALVIPVPIPPEQQKIANCLNSVDELMVAQARKVDALKTHKKVLMLQLFPRAGETQPRFRFPEFQNAEEWEESKLISLGSEPLSNGVFNDPKKVGAGYKLINVSDMYIETIIDESRLSLLELSPSEFEGNQAITGDIFLTRSSLVKSGIAVSNIYLGSSNDVTYDGHLIRFRPDKRKVVPLFAHHLFKTAPIRAQLIARGKTATMTTIGQADVASVTVFYPDTVEQHHIASCLSNLDALITLETQKLKTLNTHKKGLMQQLFPDPQDMQSYV